MLLSLQKKIKKKIEKTITNKQTNKQSNKPTTTKHTKTAKQQQHIVAPVYITDGDAIRQLL